MRSLLAADQSFRKYGKNFQLYFATAIALEKLKKKIRRSSLSLRLLLQFCSFSFSVFSFLNFLFVIFWWRFVACFHVTRSMYIFFSEA
ncbi:unnamed protein product [Coffea canephora]|uniref:Uncharacterized protein n=1 Tax=Coffea canephora TaxID=49390 RepID=A0A068UYM6_COFCA|nr:unnamed protein product [Coffea canephora]